jgi:uncharacterized protein with GYD domain
MARYVALVNWTEDGVHNFADTVDRAEEVKGLAQKMGGAVESLLWTMGPYDLVVTAEFPDDETVTAFALAVSSQGNVRTTTMRAFDGDEMRSIIGKVG